ncbi:FtsK/SpoIIIE domain-containing protein [Arthrobacter parietis]|uniref:FtsK/SpoIIIE domain-containing protein n=1 Tax=Arthrobacter parietis TaxID=271434 RepID=A0ABN3AQQ4_9MICC
MTTRVELAAERLKQAHANALGALDAACALAFDAGAEAERAAKTGYERHVAIARTRAAQHIAEHSSAARDLGVELVRSADDPLAVADYVAAGTLYLPGADSGVNQDIVVPCVLPFIGRGNVVLNLDGELGTHLIRHLVWAAYSGTAPGQLDVIGYDPTLTGLLSPFAGIKEASESAFTGLNRPRELSQVVDRLVGDVQRVNDLLRGTGDTLLDFRARTGHPVERWQALVLLDTPEGIDEETYRRLLSLGKVGPAVGISLVWLTKPEADKPGWWDQEKVEKSAEVLEAKNGALQWRAHPQFALRIARPAASELVRETNFLVASIRSASVPSVPFERIQQTERRWTDSSADGLTFAIGMAGPHVVEVTLGDERQQRHNVLVTGAVGQGKSNLLKVIVHSLCQRYAPEELQLYMLDFKAGVTLFPFASMPGAIDYLPHARVLGLESDRDFGLAVLKHLDDELGRRSRLFRPYGDDISKYRAAVTQPPLPRIVLIIDEFHMMFEPTDKTAEDGARLLEGLARRGRACGIHIVLASQTISGIAALMARENGIFAQFPIRVALKNAVAESFATLSQGNDAAARLRARGEAVLNQDYGVASANQQVVIAVANDSVLSSLQRAWWEAARRSVTPPLVFDGAHLVRLSEAIFAIQTLRRHVMSEGRAPAALVGYPIDISGTPLAISLPDDPGRHLAVLGAGEKTGSLEEAESATNNAIGILQAASVSLALQHPAGDADFVCFDFLDHVTARRNNYYEWLNLMERLGYPVQIVQKADVGAYLRTLADELLEGTVARRTYLVAFGLDRASSLETPDAFAHRPVEDLQLILRDGPVRGIHLLGWWSNAATFRNHLGFGGDGFIETMIMLRLDQASVQEFLGPFVSWSVRDNRGLVADRTQLPEPTTVVPFAPMTLRDSTSLLKVDWES